MRWWPAAVGVFVLVVGTWLVHDAGTAVVRAYSFCPSVPPGSSPAEPCVRPTGYELFPRRYAAYHATVVGIAAAVSAGLWRYRTAVWRLLDGE